MDLNSGVITRILVIPVVIILGLASKGKSDGLFCYECNRGESAEFCRLSSTLVQCDRNTDSLCLHQVSYIGGKLVARRGCILEEECRRMQSNNPNQCDPDKEDIYFEPNQTCSWCCQRDRCNFNRLDYHGNDVPLVKNRVKRYWGNSRRTTAPWQRPPRVTVPTTPPTTETTPATTTTQLPTTTTRTMVTMPPDCRDIDIMICINKFRTRVNNMILDPYRRFVQFCRSVPDIIGCVTESLQNCSCPDGVDQQEKPLTPVLAALRQECPQTCNKHSGLMCNIHSTHRILTTIMDKNGTCQILKRELMATYQCVALTVSNCGQDTFHKYNLTTTAVYKAVETICPAIPGDVTTLPPWTMGPTTSTTPRAPRIITTTTLPTTSTEHPKCQVDLGNKCLTDLNDIIMERKSEGRSLESLCQVVIPQAIQCARDATQYCSDSHVHERIELAIIYIMSLSDGECDPKCDTSAARRCIVFLYELIYNGETSRACREIDNVTKCIEKYTEACTEREKDSFDIILQQQANMTNGTCNKEPVNCLNVNETLMLIEGGEEKNLTFRTNISPTKLCTNTRGECRVFVDLLPDQGQKPLCSDGQTPISQFVIRNHTGGSSCSFEITQSNWRQVHKIPLAAKIDFKMDGNQRRQIHLRLRIVEDGKVDTLDICKYQVLVVDRDTDSFCSVTNDPHIRSFDAKRYDNMLEGFFLMYRHKKLPYEVQVGFQRCEKGATCNCAVAVKSGDSVFVMNKCRTRVPNWYSRCSQRDKDKYRCRIPLQAKTLFHGNITEGTRIFTWNGGRGFEVLLPHGGRVRIGVSSDRWRRYMLSVFLFPSPYDRDNTEGLCGSYDGDEGNDLWIDGQHVPQTWHRRTPIQFSKHWRISKEHYIFKGVDRKPFMPPSYCVCTQRHGQLMPEEDCSPKNNLETCDFDTDEEVTQILPGTDLSQVWGSGSRKKRQAINPSEEIDEFDFDYQYIPPEQYPESSNWTEISAREYCLMNLKDRYMLSQECKAIVNYDVGSEVDACIEDIMVSDSTDWIEASKQSLQEQCRYLVDVDVNSTNTAVGRLIKMQVMNVLCPGDCSGHGFCINGKCRCDGEYLGSDCSMTLDTPTDTFLADNGLCRKRENNCTSVVVYGSNFVETRTLTCHLKQIQLIQSALEEKGSEMKVRAIYLSFQQVLCPLNPSNEGLTGYYVGVSNDGIKPSKDMLFLPHDPVCFDCTLEPPSCTRKKNSCFIEDSCFVPGQINPLNNCQMCHRDNPKDVWTSIRGGHCSTLTTLPTIIAVIVTLLILIAIGVGVVYWRHKKNKKDYPARS